MRVTVEPRIANTDLSYLTRNRQLLLKLEKCEFHKFEVEFLEFVIENQGIRMNSVKIKAMKDWPKSTNIKEVQAFLGFVNYNRKFIKDYFRKAIPLINLTIKGKA